MDDNEVIVLKRALERQKKARKQAERILEEKSKELYDVTHHLKETNQRLEGLLAEQASEMDGAFLSIIDAYVIMDLKFNVVEMNDSAKEFFGFDTVSASLNLASLVHQDYVEYTTESFKSLIKVGVLRNYRSKIIINDGSEKWVQINASLIYNKDRKPIAAQGILRDITIEMEVKELLADQRREFKAIFDYSPIGIVLAYEGKILKTNASFQKLLGYTNAELLELTVPAISKDENTTQSNQYRIQMGAGTIDDFTVVKQYTKKDGSTLLAKTGVSAVRDAQGAIEYQVALVEDISMEREAEERLKAEKEKYSSIIANMNLGLLEVDNDDVILLANNSFCSMSGFAKEELIGKKASSVLKVVEPKEIEKHAKARLKGISDSYEVQIIDKEGNLKHWLVSGASRYNASKKVVGSIGIHLDITNQKHLELQKEKLLSQLEKSNEGLQEYAHIVSHDLKSPLRSVSALASWLTEDYHDVLDDSGKFNLQQIQEKIEGMDRLIDGILKYSSIDNSQLQEASVDLNLVINDIKEIIYVPKHVEIVITNPLPNITADQTKIHQLFQNIISNAVVNIEKEKGRVEIGSGEQGVFWLFSIKDNGKGIPKEYHKKIFKIFQSIDDGNRSTGIGLSIVKKIVHRYGGRIWLESEVGTGTTFYFTLKK